MDIYLGVDGGGSKTFVLAADTTGRVLGFGQAGCANHQVHSLDAALAEIGGACRQALGVSAAGFASFCLAGADLPPDFVMLRPKLESLGVAAKFDLRNDSWAAMRAGTSHPWGAVVICGSGINAAVRTPDGREFVLPSLGQISGDWGGGGDIAMAAISAIAREWDGRGPPTALTERVLRFYEQPNYAAMLEAIYIDALPRRNRELAPLVFEVALDGDAVAQEIVVRCGTEIGHIAGSLLHRMGMHREPCEVVTGGSIFKAEGPLLMDAANLALHRLAPVAFFTRAKVEPVVGALLLAFELHGREVDEALLANLQATLPAQLLNHRS
jgi:N-acetylglucosamine kinase-like BadF-type ATPase